MKKALTFIFALLILASCKVYQDPHLPQATLTQEEKNFVAQFEDAAVKHKRSLLNSYLYPSYKSEQLDGMYQGDSKAFWNQFFCGKLWDDQDKFTCLKLNNVRNIYLIRVNPTDKNTEKELIFKVEGYDNTVKVILILKTYTDDSGQKQYGIIGAYG